MLSALLSKIQEGDTRALARGISLLENNAADFAALKQLPASTKPVIGITGPPGAGKSTLVDRLLQQWTNENKKIAVLCIDPSSPFHHGALLGDRIRMNQWYNDPRVYIRSLSTRGSLGGLHPKIIEIIQLLYASVYDLILIETVGVGQSEVEIAGLADCTVVVLVPEAGDMIQNMKAGLMEVADIFVVNKSDRPDALTFAHNLEQTIHTDPSQQEIPVIKTVADRNEGVVALATTILDQLQRTHTTDRRAWLLAKKAYELIVKEKMKDIDPTTLQEKIQEALTKNNFQLFQFVDHFLKSASMA